MSGMLARPLLAVAYKYVGQRGGARGFARPLGTRSPRRKELVLSPLMIILTILWFLSGIALVILILMHSGKGTGVSEMIAGSMYSNTSGSGIIERNLDRLTIICAVVFVALLFVFMIFFPQGSIATA